jgi:hypothetical protein
MTQCTQSEFEFASHFSRRVVANFDGGAHSSDAGLLLLRELAGKLKLFPRLAQCFTDFRVPDRCEHGVEQMLAQRVLSLAMGYEDLNDHDQLRHDPLLALAAGKRDADPLASKSTLCRLEGARQEGCAEDRYKRIRYSQESIDRLLVELFLEAHREAPKQIVLDLDVTDTAIHGHQEGRFFHGFYGHYCYLPLYIFCGQHLLCARLREANQDASAGSLEELERIVAQIREQWGQTRIVIRADSGFCREEILAWCEQNQVDYVIGLARNSRLRTLAGKAMRKAAAEHKRTGKAARAFTEFGYRTRESWSRTRRVVAKAEQIEGKENPRYVVTSLGAKLWQPRALYEQLYCARGEMENRIKEQLSLFADRVSAATMRANQLRLYLSAMAYTLMENLRRRALQGTELARAQATTIRLRLLKIGAQLRQSARRFVVTMPTSYPLQGLFQQVWTVLRC